MAELNEKSETVAVASISRPNKKPDHRIYLDNAATTALDPEVLQAMLPYLTDHFGNPSSIYSYGRETRLAIENARKLVSSLLGVKPGSIFFTSGGTESNNTAIAAAIRDLGCNHIITSPVEHHAVLHTVDHYVKEKHISSSMVALDAEGHVQLNDLEAQLKSASAAGKKTLVSLMHANNEIGLLLPIQAVGVLCETYGAIFHSDCVQTIGHYKINLEELKVHFASAAGHKFHGPKGTGILYIKEGIQINPLIFGGGQERNMRAGTENVYGIAGFAKALEISMRDWEKVRAYLVGLKGYMAQRLMQEIPGVSFNSNENSLYTVLSVSFPKTEKSSFILMNLDIHNICVSGGSACSSGTDIGSHVMQALNKAQDQVTIRFSFSKHNTKNEVDIVVNTLRELLN